MHKCPSHKSANRQRRKPNHDFFPKIVSQKLDYCHMQDIAATCDPLMSLPSPPPSGSDALDLAEQGSKQYLQDREWTYRWIMSLQPFPSSPLVTDEPQATKQEANRSPVLSFSDLTSPSYHIPNFESADDFSPPRDQDWVLYPGLPSSCNCERLAAGSNEYNAGDEDCSHRIVNAFPYRKVTVDTDCIGRHCVVNRGPPGLQTTSTEHLLPITELSVACSNDRQESDLISKLDVSSHLLCSTCHLDRSSSLLDLNTVPRSPSPLVLPPQPTIPRLGTPELPDIGPEEWL